jgi:hypothetical protein
MPDPVLVLRGEPQVDGQPFGVGEQALHRRRVGRRVPAGHLGDPVIDELDEPGTVWRQGCFPFDKLIKIFPLEQINEAEQAAIKGEVVKPVLVPAGWQGCG